MAYKITNEQMRNVILNNLFKRKSDAKRSAHNISLVFEDCPQLTARGALEFELQSYYHYKDGKKYVFFINKDYSTTDFECDDLEKVIDLAHEYLLEKADWYKALVR